MKNVIIKDFIIPIEVVLNPILTEREKLLFGLIHPLDKTRGCYASNSYFATVLNSSTTTISLGISSLEKQGYISVEIKRTSQGSQRKIKVLPSFREKFRDLVDKTIKKLEICYEKNTYSQKTLPKIKTRKRIRGTEKLFNPLITFWNSLPNLTKHKDPSKKVYQKSCDLLKQLKKGTFFHKNSISKEFLTKHHIPHSISSHSFKDEEIQEGMRQLSFLMTNGWGYTKKSGFYWPDSDTRKKINTSLSNMIYNPMTGSSMFLLVYFSPPKKINQDIESIEIPFDRSWLEPFRDHVSISINKWQQKDFIRRVQKIQHQLVVLISENETLYPTIRMNIGSEEDPRLFFQQYIRWLEEEYYKGKQRKIPISSLGPNSSNWESFCIFLNDEGYGYKVDGIKKID